VLVTSPLNSVERFGGNPASFAADPDGAFGRTMCDAATAALHLALYLAVNEFSASLCHAKIALSAAILGFTIGAHRSFIGQRNKVGFGCEHDTATR
jgi:hypothetical protein